jgi:hypothetical protein
LIRNLFLDDLRATNFCRTNGTHGFSFVEELLLVKYNTSYWEDNGSRSSMF